MTNKDLINKIVPPEAPPTNSWDSVEEALIEGFNDCREQVLKNLENLNLVEVEDVLEKVKSLKNSKSNEVIEPFRDAWTISFNTALNKVIIYLSQLIK